jgi:hypothetical protein
MPRTGWTRQSCRKETIRTFNWSSMTLAAMAVSIVKLTSRPSSICLKASTKARFGSSLSTPPKDGRKVSADVANELRQRCDLQMRFVPSGPNSATRNGTFGGHQATGEVNVAAKPVQLRHGDVTSERTRRCQGGLELRAPVQGI